MFNKSTLRTACVLPLMMASFFSFATDSVDTEAPQSQPQAQLTPEQKIEQLWASLTPQYGEVSLSDAEVTLKLPEGFYYLNSKDSHTLLTDIWGNPPMGVLGVIMPESADSDWAVTINYSGDGYVSDEDAAEINYNDLLQTLKEDAKAQNDYRLENGYESIELIGWASEPYYDANTHKLHWAQEYNFGGASTNSLNYDVRILGRKGYLEMSFIAGIDQLENVKAAIPDVLAMTEFNAGAKYSDFQPGVDKVAAYGIGGLIAGKVLAKTGFFAVLILLLKKFWVFIVIGIGAAFKMLFGKKKSDEPDAEAKA